jgi:hypothetical protein
MKLSLVELYGAYDDDDDDDDTMKTKAGLTTTATR